MRGPGETQLEVDRRQIRSRLSFLKGELEGVRLQRQQHRAQRKRAQIPVVSIVGYTNAGKSSLLNALVDASGSKQTPVLAEDAFPRLFIAQQKSPAEQLKAVARVKARGADRLRGGCAVLESL